MFFFGLEMIFLFNYRDDAFLTEIFNLMRYIVFINYISYRGNQKTVPIQHTLDLV